MPNSFPMKSDDSQYAKLRWLFDKIKDITKRPHIYNLIEALELLLKKLQMKDE